MLKVSDAPLFATIKCRQLSEEDETLIRYDGFEVTRIHKSEEPCGVNRILLSHHDMTVELLPSKGLSIGEALYNQRPIFWDSPAELFNPDELVLDSEEICFNGKPERGLAYIKTFTGGIELLGLGNWGMHYTNPGTQEFNILHGEVAHIPVDEITVALSESELHVEGSFIVRTFQGNPRSPWYQRGKSLYTVTRSLSLQKGQPALYVTDTITNISEDPLTPDWGYHVTLRPEKGAEFLIPSKIIQNRDGGAIPPNHAIWQPSVDDQKRVEIGIIHQDLKISPDTLGNGDGVCSLLRYPDGTGIAVTTPPAPYFQTWFCAGGANSKEFTYADGTPVLKKNWDGQGIEFGASSLDHDGNIDPIVIHEPILRVGESLEIMIYLEVLCSEDTVKLVEDIQAYNKDRS